MNYYDEIDTGPVYQQHNIQSTTDDDVISGLQDDHAAISRQQASAKQENHNYDDTDDGLTTSIKEPNKLRLLESLFPSHQSSPWTDSIQALDRQLQHDQEAVSPSGGVVDTDHSDDVSRRWAGRKYRKRVLPDELPQTRDISTTSIERQREFPGRGKIRRRQHTSSQRHRKTRKHRRADSDQGRRRQVSSRYHYSPASLPINVAIRLLGERQRRSRYSHRRGRHRPRWTRQLTRFSRSPTDVLNNRRSRRSWHRPVSTQRRNTSDFGQAASSTPVSAVVPPTDHQSSTVNHSSSTPSHSSTAMNLSSDTNVKFITSKILLIYRLRRATLTAGDANRQRQRLIMEKLLEATMSEAERVARNLTSKRLDELFNGTRNDTKVEGPFWRVELSPEQRTFVAVVIVIAVIVAVGTLIFACVWCLLDQDGLCPQGWCRWLGTPKDTFSPQRWWMEALAQRVENLEAGQPLIERTGRRKKSHKKSRKKSIADESEPKEPKSTGDKDKKQATDATQSKANENATDALFSGLADNKMIQ